MATEADKVEAVGAVPLFADLSKRQLRRVVELGRIVGHPADKVITREGATGHGFHVVLDGEVEVSVGGESRATLGPGAYFGEMALLDGGPRTATVSARTVVRELVIEPSEFRHLIESDPAIASQMLRAMSRRLREAESSLQA